MRHPITFALVLLLAYSAPTQAQAQSQAPTGDFALKNVHTGKYVRIKDANSADHTPIVAYSPVNWKCVTWHLQPAEGGAYTLKNLFSGKTLQPVDGQAAPGTALEELPVNQNSKAQQYELIAAGNAQYRIKLKGTELYLQPEDPRGATNSAIILQPQQTGDLQLWTLVEQHPTM
jgi:hypothetical protein